MNCPEIRAALPDLLYGQLKPEHAQNVHSHLAECVACQAEWTGLRQTVGLLDKLPVPPVSVDLREIYRQSHLAEERRLRHWRRAAFALIGIAAAVVFAMLLHLEVRVDGRQLVLRWGGAREVTAKVVSAVMQPPQAKATKQHERRETAPPEVTRPEVTRADLNLMRDLLHAVAAEVDGRDRQQRESLAALQQQLDRLERATQERWAATLRYVSANTRSDDQEKEGVNP
jgi:hypothetical protein